MSMAVILLTKMMFSNLEALLRIIRIFRHFLPSLNLNQKKRKFMLMNESRKTSLNLLPKR